MKPEAIMAKMRTHQCSQCKEIHLDIRRGEPHSKKGGIWTSVKPEELEYQLNEIKEGRGTEESRGWKRHLDRWESEGKINKSDRQ